MADPLGLAFGPVVRRERKRLGLTQAELGMRAGLGVLAATAGETLAQIERGARSNPGLLTIEKLAAGLEMRPWELLALVELFASAAPFTHPTAGTETGDLPSPGITRVEDLTA